MKRSIAAAGLIVLAPSRRAGTTDLCSGVDVVSVDVSVMNGLSPVPGLTTEQFAITDNGVPEEVESVSRYRSAEPDDRARYQRQHGRRASEV